MRVGAAVPGSAGLSGFVNGGLRSFGGAIRRAESVLLGGGQQTARRNAWDAVCENRRWARDREDLLPALDLPAVAPAEPGQAGGTAAGR